MTTPPQYGPLRIVRWPRGFGVDGGPNVKEYWERLAKMKPAEVTGFYLTFRPFVVDKLTPDEIHADWLAQWWPWIGVGLVILVRAWATRASSSWLSAQPTPVVVATIAFILWVITMGHEMAILSNYAIFREQRVAAILAALFTFIVPMFYKGDPPPRVMPAPTEAGK